MAADPETVLRAVTNDIWNEGRLERVDALVAADFIDHVELPALDDLAGRVRYRASVEAVRRAFPDYRERIEFVVADQERAVSYARITGTHSGDLMGLPPTGRVVDYRSIGILRVRDGQVIERWGVGDTATMLGQLGLLA